MYTHDVFFCLREKHSIHLLLLKPICQILEPIMHPPVYPNFAQPKSPLSNTIVATYRP